MSTSKPKRRNARLVFCLNFSSFHSVCQQVQLSVPRNRAKKHLVARAAYAKPATFAARLTHKLSAHGSVDVVLPNSCAGNHVRKFSSTVPNSSFRFCKVYHRSIPRQGNCHRSGTKLHIKKKKVFATTGGGSCSKPFRPVHCGGGGKKCQYNDKKVTSLTI